MQTKWKRNAVVATMAVLVCAAAVLNWKYSSDLPVEEADKILGEAELVSGQETVEEITPVTDETAVYGGADYFSSARLTRQQARDNALALLREASEQEGADEAALTEAAQEIQVLASYTLKESQIENLVTAKGYVDCVAFMGDTSVSVVVSTESGELTAEDVVRITDIAVTETGLKPGAIRIMAAN